MLRWEAWELRVWTRLQASRENGLWGVQAAPLRRFEVVLERVVVQTSVQQWGWEDGPIGYLLEGGAKGTCCHVGSGVRWGSRVR